MNNQGFFKMFKKIDIFSSSFQFNIEYQQYSKKTAFGGFLMCIIFGLSLSYLGYLVSLYFQNQILPKISSSEDVSLSLSFQADKNQFIFTMMIDNMPHRAYARLKGKNYVKYLPQYVQGKVEDKVPNVTDLNIIQCEDQQYSDYDCIDLNSSNNLLSVTPHEQMTISNTFLIWVFPCSGTNNNCALDQDIQAVFTHPANHFYFLGRVDQYNVNSQMYKNTYILHAYQLSQDMCIFSTIQAQTQLYKIRSGLIIQTIENDSKIKSYKRVDGYQTKNDFLGKMGAYVGIAVSIDQNIFVTEIQFPQITEIIAQFTGVLNILLILGFLGRNVSKSQIYKEIKDVVIRNTYINKIKNQNLQLNNIKNIDLVRVQPFSDANSQQQLISSSSRNSSQKFENIEESIIKFLPQQQKDKLKGHFDDRTENLLDIRKHIQEFLFMQRAIKVMLTKEQYFALKHCGEEIGGLLSSDNKKIDSEGQLQNLELEQSPQTQFQTPQVIPILSLSHSKNIDQSGNKLIVQSDAKKKQQEESPQSHFQIMPTQTNNNYLSEIQKIEQNFEEQERLIKQYLKSFEQKDTRLSITDYNIYSSLMQQQIQQNNNP